MTTRTDEGAAVDPSEGDPHQTLGIVPGVSDAELRRAYHRLALLHHPDRNGSSPLASKRFAEIQDAYNTILSTRRTRGVPRSSAGPTGPTDSSGRPGSSDAAGRPSPRHTWAEPWLDERITAIERNYETQRHAEQYGNPPRETPRQLASDSLRQRLTDLFRGPDPRF